jgi:hypothetical protein
MRALVDLPLDEALEALGVDLAILERRYEGRDRALEGRHGHENSLLVKTVELMGSKNDGGQ